ncbi:zinc dependent phospholipase C family protein [Virgibacillus oceani]
MPNIWTHILFCEEVSDAVKKPYPFSQTESYMKLGAQGPDPFFYFNFWPWADETFGRKIGMALHTKQCGNFLKDMITKAKKESQEIQAYVLGFITHHILDRNTHPYIHYHAGYDGTNHQKLEILIDTIMMKKYYNLKTWKAPVHKEIDVGSKLNVDICIFLHKVIQDHYPELKLGTSFDYIQKAYRDMRRALRILSDPYGWKNIILKPFISSYSHQPIKDNIDYLNLKETTWYHPATNEAYEESFVELYDKSRLESVQILTEVQHYWHDDQTDAKENIDKLIGNISYDTGLPLECQMENKYSEPIV